MLAGLFRQGADHGMAGGIGGMDDAAPAVAAFAGQVIAEFGLLVLGERNAPVDQPLDGFAAMFDDEARCLFIAQARAGHERVLRMLVVAVARIEHGGDPALCPVAGACVMARLLRMTTRWVSASCSATVRPASPLPTMATSKFMVQEVPARRGVGGNSESLHPGVPPRISTVAAAASIGLWPAMAGAASNLGATKNKSPAVAGPSG